jgi:Flp pilus assembly protein TadG
MRPRFDERGATMVEAAIAALLAFTLIFGLFQTALFARAYLVARDGSTAGAQAGAVSANDANADFDVLQAINTAASSTSKSAIEQIVVYKASGPGSSVPAQCLTSGAQAGVCNVYTGADLSLDTSAFSAGSYTKDNPWPATTRGVSRSAGPDYLGVYIKVSCRCAGAFALPGMLDKTSVVRLQATVP